MRTLAVMNGKRLLLFLLSTYAALTVMLSFFGVTPALAGLSTVLGTTIFTSTVLGSSLLSTTTLVAAYNHALLVGQVAIGVSTIGFLFFTSCRIGDMDALTDNLPGLGRVGSRCRFHC